jgi:septal ring-binding cell division protein DamX
MGILQFFSTLALGTLAISSFEFVAARPHRHHHHSGVDDVSSQSDVYVTTIYTTVHKTVHTRYTQPAGHGSSQIPNSFSAYHSSRPVKSAANSTIATSTKDRTTKARPTHTKSFTTSTTSPTSTEPAPSATGGAYSLVKSYCSESFFDQFNFFTGEDPTHGFVEYVHLFPI